MNRPSHFERSVSVPVLVAVLVIFLFNAAPAVAQDRSDKYEGWRLADALRALQSGGLRIVFSSEIVTPDMRVTAAPRAKVARQILDELLAPHGLKAEEGPAAVIQVLRAKPAREVDPRRQPSDTATGTIQGQVVDAETHAPLRGVLVQVVGTPQEARTDEEGRFQLRDVPAGTQTLYVSMVGYALVRRPLRVAGGRTLTIPVALAPGTGTYSERVTVTAPRLERQDPGVGSEVSLGSGELQNLNGVLAVDAMRAVHTLPRVATGDDFRSEFSVRGSPYRHVGVVVDGVTTPWLQHGVYGGADTGSIAMLNSDVLEQATLQAGAYPHRYGDRLGAQLSLTLREGSRAATQLRGAVSGTNATLVVEGPIGRSERGSWLFTLRQSYLEWPTKILQDFSGRAFGFTDAQAKLVYDVRPSQQLSLSLLGGRSRMDERGEREPHELALGTNRAAVVNLGWRSTFGSSLVLNQRAYLVAHQFLNKNQTGQDRSRGTDRELSYRADLARTTFGGLLEAGVQAQRLHGSRHVPQYDEAIFNAGGLPQPESVERFPPGFPPGFEGSAWLRSGYAHFKWNPTPRLTIAPGLRVADSTLVHRPPPRRAVGRWILGEWSFRSVWTLHGSTGVSHQFPEFEHLFGVASTVASTAPLRPERATHIDIGIERRLSKSVRLQATIFNREEREILREPDTHPRLVSGILIEPPSPGGYENALSGSSRGTELLLERRSATGLSGWAAYSYGKTRHTDAARHETFWADFDQRHAINVSGVYRLSDRTSIAVKFRGGTNFPIPGYLVARDGGLFAGSQRNEVRLPSYARLDVRANRTFNYTGRRLTLFVEILNVLNRTNVGLADGFIRRGTGEAAGLTEELFPRLPTAGLLIEF